jgi:Transposase and inactivated derivatives
MLVVVCPFCQGPDVIRFGTTVSGSARLRCKACKKTWSPQPKSRSLTPEKEAAIVRALAERVSQRGIARAFQVSRDTIRALRKKTQIESSEQEGCPP